MKLSGNIRQNTDNLGDIENWVASYLGNGIVGGCFDFAGLQFKDGKEGRADIIGDTYFVSQYHYVHGKYGMDYALPIGRLQARVQLDGQTVEPSDPSDITEIDQRLDIGDGILYTSYTLSHGPRVEQTQFFSQIRKNLFVLRAHCEHPIHFEFYPIYDTPYHYASHFTTDVTTREIDGCIVHEIPTNMETTAVALKQDGDTLYIAVYSTFETDNPSGACVKEIESAASTGFDKLMEEHKEWWREYWAKSNINLPYPLGEIWQRANYYIGCSLAAQKTHPPLVFGLARVQWPSYFPQDFFYAYENTFRANHMEQAVGTSEFWFDNIQHARDYAGYQFKLKGAVYPWTPPVFDWHNYHIDGEVPNGCYYELHNSAYVAKMCWDYYLHSCDEEYLKEKAYPVIVEIARMYASMTTIKDGRAQILYTPNRSQDEYTSKENLPNLFDTMVSAEWTLSLARDLAVRFDDSEIISMCDKILTAGYVYDRLEYDNIYVVYEGDTRVLDFQKHPVQLNPLTWLPISRFFEDQRTINYHTRRYDICRGYKDASSTAWTLGQFMLASSRLRRPEEFAKDIQNIHRCKIMDPGYIQTFESSRKAPHFLTTIGLFMQAITDTLVQTHNGFAEFFPCILPEWKGLEIGFTTLRLPGGFLASGNHLNGIQSIEIQSLLGRHFEFSLPDETRDVEVLDGSGNVVYSGPASNRVGINTKQGEVYSIQLSK